MQYVRWVSERNKLDLRESTTEQLNKEEQLLKRVTELRVFTNYVGSIFVRGGDEIGHVSYIKTFSSTLD